MKRNSISARPIHGIVHGDCATVSLLAFPADYLHPSHCHSIWRAPRWVATKRSSVGYSDVPAYSQILQLRLVHSYGRRLSELRLRASRITPLTLFLNLPTPGRRQSLYILLRVGRDLCF